MTKADHIAEAEKHIAQANDERLTNNAGVHATLALAHAQLASVVAS